MKKRIAVFAAVLLTLLGPALWLNTRTGVTIHDQFLYRRSPGVYKSISGWEIKLREGNSTAIFNLRFGGSLMSAELIWNDPLARFTFSDGTIVEGFWDGGDWLTDEEGLPLFLSDSISIDVFRGGSSPPNSTAICDELLRVFTGKTEPLGSVALVLLGALIYCAGAARFLWPEEVHFLFSRWRYNHAELSDDGLLAEQIGAVIILICSAAVMYAPLFV